MTALEGRNDLLSIYNISTQSYSAYQAKGA